MNARPVRANAGLWRNAAYRIRDAGNPQRLMRLRNSFQLIEGRVRQVAPRSRRIYVNFGEDWRTDFTAGAALKAAGFSAEALAAIKALEGRRVRVRGWIERRNGPYIELLHPHQIEAVDDEPRTGPRNCPRRSACRRRRGKPGERAGDECLAASRKTKSARNRRSRAPWIFENRL